MTDEVAARNQYRRSVVSARALGLRIAPCVQRVGRWNICGPQPSRNSWFAGASRYRRPGAASCRITSAKSWPPTFSSSRSRRTASCLSWCSTTARGLFRGDEGPRYLLHDRDHAFDSLRASGRWESRKCSRLPARLGKIHSLEPFIGSARRNCFDHVIVFNEAGLLRLMTRYCSYYERVPYALVAGQLPAADRLQ